MTEKNANANENTTAEVQVHSKFLTTGSARSFALTSTLGTFMRPPPLRPVLPRPRPGSCPNRMDSSPRTLSRLGPTRVCESVHKPSQLSQDRLADRNPGRRGTTAGRAVLPGAPSYTCRVTGVLADWVQDGLGSWWAPGLAFAAGVISFGSPCVFPLVPGYLSFVAGGEVRDERQPVVPILLFIAGFAAVFSALGAFTGAMTRLLRSTAGIRISGAIIISFGVLMLLYALRLGSPGLFLERRPLLERARPGRAWAFPLGVAFGAGWTPCIGPVLAGVLAIAGSQGGSLRGALLLFVYSPGLGLPFLSRQS